jgi:soluble lytic murein transglycosylase-like protein
LEWEARGLRPLKGFLLPVLLAACGGLQACATSTGPTASLAPVSGVEPMLPETVSVMPSFSPGSGSTEDGMRSLAREVEVNGGAQTAAYAGPTPASAVNALAAATTAPAPQQALAAATAAPAPQQVALVSPQPEPLAAAVLSPEQPAGPDFVAPPTERLGPEGGVAARSPELDQLIKRYAEHYEVPEELVRKVAKRESTFNPGARNGSYFGLMQISHATARGMGYRGTAAGLFDAETNLKYAVRYLRGAYLVAKGNLSLADRLYQRGYYYDAKRAGLLDETGLGRDRIRRRRL